MAVKCWHKHFLESRCSCILTRVVLQGELRTQMLLARAAKQVRTPHNTD